MSIGVPTIEVGDKTAASAVRDCVGGKVLGLGVGTVARDGRLKNNLRTQRDRVPEQVRVVSLAKRGLNPTVS